MSEDKNNVPFGSQNKYDRYAAEVFKNASGWVNKDKSEVTDSSKDRNKNNNKEPTADLKRWDEFISSHNKLIKVSATKRSDDGVYSNTSSSSSKKQDSQTTMIISKEKTSSSVTEVQSVKISKKRASADGVSELEESTDWIGRSDEMKYNVQRCKKQYGEKFTMYTLPFWVKENRVFLFQFLTTT